MCIYIKACNFHFCYLDVLDIWMETYYLSHLEFIFKTLVSFFLIDDRNTYEHIILNLYKWGIKPIFFKDGDQKKEMHH